MILLFIVIALSGWFVGVHSPWWVLVVLWGVLVYRLHNDKGGLETIPSSMGIIVFIVTSLVSGLIFGEVGFEGFNFKWLFTGE